MEIALQHQSAESVVVALDNLLQLAVVLYLDDIAILEDETEPERMPNFSLTSSIYASQRSPSAFLATKKTHERLILIHLTYQRSLADASPSSEHHKLGHLPCLFPRVPQEGYLFQKTPPLLPFSREALVYRAMGDGSSCNNYSRMGPVLLFHLSFLVKKMEGVVRDSREKLYLCSRYINYDIINIIKT